jgi:hypothetical protein
LSRVRSSSILAARIFPEERGDHVGQRSARPIVLERDADERAAVGPGLEAHGAERLLPGFYRRTATNVVQQEPKSMAPTERFLCASL